MSRRALESHPDASDPIKENRRMPKRLASLAVLVGAAVLLLALPSLASATSPWWQIVDGSRPTHMWEPTDNVQEIAGELNEFPGPGTEGFARPIEVDGATVGCLGTKNADGTAYCEGSVGFPPTETAAELEALIETAFGFTSVQVSGGPVGGAPFIITTPDRTAPVVRLQMFAGGFGEATSKILDQGGSGRLTVVVGNLGDAPLDATSTPVKIVDKLPAGLAAYDVEAFPGFFNFGGSIECAIEAADEVACDFTGSLAPYKSLEVEIEVSLEGSPPVAGAPGRIDVSGGNAPAASAAQTIEVSPDPVPFGIERFSARAEEEGGAPAGQAGGHPFQLTTTVQLNSGTMTPGPDRQQREIDQPAIPRNLAAPLPPGLVGNATVMPTCKMEDFTTIVPGFYNKCPDNTAVGVASVTFIDTGIFKFVPLAVPIFNLPPTHGEPARFGFMPLGNPVLIDTSVEPENGYRINAEVVNTTQLVQFMSSTVSFWGTPGDPRHDTTRGWGCVYFLPVAPCERPSGLPEGAFLRMPVSCATPLESDLSVEPWNVPLGSVIDSASFTSEPLTGCNRVPFDPSVEASPTSKLAENPSGLSFKLNMPNSGLLNRDGIAEGQPKRVEVTLPEGVTLNPSAANGLAVCSPSELARETSSSRPGEGCPNASRIGDVRIQTPLIDEDPEGALYLAKPYDNPFNSLLALYIVARAPERGVLVKLAGKVEPDPKTGQIVTTFDDAPQLPFSSFDLRFREGSRAPLVTPPACGNYDVLARFVPWSAEDPDDPAPEEIVTRKSSFAVEKGVDGGACPSAGVPPFAPEFEAGSINNNAKSYSPFNMRLIRHDGEQNMTKFSSVLPPGVVGKLVGVGKCPDAAIAAAKAKTGEEELASPSCPAGSQIGRVLAGGGVGPVLTYVKGSVYLAGPYNGAPLSVVAVVPGVAGPFDVGTIVTREALNLNPKTAEVEVDGAASDPIPHILKGIPLKVRDLRVYVDRDNFTLNPTSCDPSTAKATLFGSYLDVFSSADDKPIGLSTRYQAANCLNLGFKPNLALNLKGGTKRGGHPGLKAIYTPRKGDANLKGLSVRLPSSAFLDQAHIRTICTRVQFAADNCPKAAQYGYIKAWTPLLEEPLEGPVWLRSSNHKLPDMVFDLHGLVDVEVATRIDSQRGGIRATLEDAPDAPISKVVLTMQGAKKGLIVNSKNLCSSTNKANAAFDGQNGKEFSAKPVLRPDCGGKRKG